MPDRLVGDLRLGQILINLTDNAIKFTAQGQVVVRVIQQSATSGETILQFSVSDTGIGIPAEKQATIFEAFAQVDSTTTRVYGGTGLGLAIASQLIQKMHGKIWIESQLGEGTTFHFTARLPVRQFALPAPPSAGKTSPAAEPARRPPAVPLRILLAEDNAINRAVAKGFLEREGHVLVYATNGREAVEACKSGAFDMIFMDLQMPEMGGMEATRLIRALEAKSGRHTPIIAMTAAAMVGDRERCLAGGMDGYVAKPMNKAKLLEVIAEFGIKTEERPLPTPPSEHMHNAEELLQQLGGDPELVERIIALFREHVPGMMATFRTALKEGDLPAVARTAHALVGSFGAVGATHAVSVARDLEAAAGRADVAVSTNLIAALEDEAHTILAGLPSIADTHCAVN